MDFQNEIENGGSMIPSSEFRPMKDLRASGEDAFDCCSTEEHNSKISLSSEDWIIDLERFLVNKENRAKFSYLFPPFLESYKTDEGTIMIKEDPECNLSDGERSSDGSFHLNWDDDMLEDKPSLAPISATNIKQDLGDIEKKEILKPSKKRRRKKTVYSKRRKVKKNCNINLKLTQQPSRGSILKDVLPSPSQANDLSSTQSSTSGTSLVSQLDGLLDQSDAGDVCNPTKKRKKSDENQSSSRKPVFSSRKLRSEYNLFLKNLVKSLSESVVFEEVDSNSEEYIASTFKCAFCKFEHRKLSCLRNHVHVTHFNLITFQCLKCNFLRYYPSVCIPIVKSLHACNGKADNNSYSDPNRNSFKVVKTFFHDKKNKCGYSEYLQQILKAPFNCGLCYHAPETATALQKHMQKAHSNLVLFKCDECNFFGYYPFVISKSIKSLHRCKQIEGDSKGERSSGNDLCDSKDERTSRNDIYKSEDLKKLPDIKCDLCSFTGKSKKSINVHMKGKHRRTRSIFCCDKCGLQKIIYPRQAQFFKTYHLCKQPLNMVHFVCDLCPFETRRQRDVYKHKKKCHMKKTPLTSDIFPCEFCSFVYDSFPDLEVHLKKVHSDSVKWKCEKCGFSSTNSLEKIIDIKEQHICNSINSLDITINEISTKDHESSFKVPLPILNTAKTFCCTICEQITNSDEELNNHLVSSHKLGRSTKCPFCNYFSYGISSMQKHISHHHSGPKLESRSHPKSKSPVICCPSCMLVGAGGSQAQYFQQQGHINSRSQKFFCHKCCFACYCKVYLQYHIQNCHGVSETEKNYSLNSTKNIPPKECPSCQVVGKGGSYSKKHRNEGHLNLRIMLFSCENCKFSCFCKEYLRYHIRTFHADSRRKVSNEKIIPVVSRSGTKPPDLDASEETDTSSETEDTNNLDECIDSDRLDDPLSSDELPAKKAKIIPRKKRTYFLKTSKRILNESPGGFLDDFCEELPKDPETDPLEMTPRKPDKDEAGIGLRKEVLWKRIPLTEWSDYDPNIPKHRGGILDYEGNIRERGEILNLVSLDPNALSFGCESCPKYFTNKIDRNAHHQRHHIPGHNKKENLQIKTVFSKCEKCMFVTNDDGVMKEHLMTAHQLSYSYLCPFCCFKALNNELITAHVILDHSCLPEGGICAYCEHSYANCTHNHRLLFDRTNIGVRPYYCSHCDFICTTDTNFLQHVISEHV